MASNPSLTSAGEAIWSRFQRSLKWQEGFALIFLFSDYPQVTELFRQRLADIYRARVRGLRLLRETPTDPETLSGPLLRSLFQPDSARDSLAAPLWVELNQGSGDAWQQARRDFLARLNERRTPFMRNHPWPVILCLPTATAPEISQYAPDLWAIRQQSLTLGDWLPTRRSKQPVTQPGQNTANDQDPHAAFPFSAAERSQLDEWARVKDLPHADAGILRTGWAASQACMRRGHWQQKARIDNAVLARARALVEDSRSDMPPPRPPAPPEATPKATPEALRDLSVSLNNVGRTHEALAQWEQARQVYSESLSVRRDLLQRVGETPEALRDLSVSLDNVGRTHQALAQWEQARDCFQQGLELGRQLANAFPHLPEFTELPEHFQNRLAALNPPPPSAS